VAFLAAEVFDVVEVASVSELVQIDCRAFRLVKQVADEVASDETCSARYEDPIHSSHTASLVHETTGPVSPSSLLHQLQPCLRPGARPQS